MQDLAILVSMFASDYYTILMYKDLEDTINCARALTEISGCMYMKFEMTNKVLPLHRRTLNNPLVNLWGLKQWWRATNFIHIGWPGVEDGPTVTDTGHYVTVH